MGRPAQSGQAAVEWMGMLVVVALLMAALAAWGAREMQPPERPPDPIAAVTEPLGAAAQQFERVGNGLPWFVQHVGAGGGAGRRALTWLADASTSVAFLGRDLGVAFGVSFWERLRARGMAILTSPASTLSSLPDPNAGTVIGTMIHTARGLVEDPTAVPDYVRRLIAMSPREAAVAVSGDLGTFVADATIVSVEQFVKRMILRAATRGRGAPAPRVP